MEQERKGSLNFGIAVRRALEAIAKSDILTTLNQFSYAIRIAPKDAGAAMFFQAASGVLQGLALVTLIPVFKSISAAELTTQTWAHTENRQWVFGFGVGAFILIGWLAAGSKFLASYFNGNLRPKIERALHSRMLESFCAVPWERYNELRIGGATKALVADGENFSRGAQWLISSLSHASAMAALLGTAFLIKPVLAMVCLACFALLRLTRGLFSRQTKNSANELDQFLRLHAETTAEVLSGMKYFRLSGSTTYAMRKVRESFNHFQRHYLLTVLSHVSAQLLLELGAVLIIGILLVALEHQRGPLGEEMAFLGLLIRMMPYAINTQKNFHSAKEYQYAAVGWLRLYGQLQVRKQVRCPKVAATFDRKLAFREVSYGYPDKAGDTAIHKVSFSLSKKDSVAIVGASGSGKSTLLDLVTGLLEPQSGEISLDGIPLSDVDMEDWRKRIGFVPQNCPLFHGTILNNLALGETHPNEAKAKKALESAGAMSFIERLPLGIHSEIGEGGAFFSGGERQRLAIARALYRDPWLLILDEATSALDKENERKIIESIAALKGKLALIVVTHSQDVVKICDQVLVMNEGVMRPSPRATLSSDLRDRVRDARATLE